MSAAWEKEPHQYIYAQYANTKDDANVADAYKHVIAQNWAKLRFIGKEFISGERAAEFADGGTLSDRTGRFRFELMKLFIELQGAANSNSNSGPNFLFHCYFTALQIEHMNQ